MSEIYIFNSFLFFFFLRGLTEIPRNWVSLGEELGSHKLPLNPSASHLTPLKRPARLPRGRACTCGYQVAPTNLCEIGGRRGRGESPAISWPPYFTQIS